MREVRDYKVKSPLNHDGQDYPIGATVSMTEKQAEPLLGGALARPGEDLTSNDVAQGVQAVQAEAAHLVEVREQLTEEQLALDEALRKLASDRADLATAQEKLSADRQELDKQLKATAKKST